MTLIVERIEECVFWRDGDSFGREETVTILFDDTSTEVHVSNERPPMAEEITETEYLVLAAQQNKALVRSEAEARQRLLETIENRRKAMEKLTQLGLTDAEVDALGGV